MFNVAIIGAGNIAGAMAEAVNGIGGDICPYAIASRDIVKAEEFRDKWNFKKAYGTYEELLNDKDVNLVYIATPHSHHYEHARMCIEHGIPVLVEKAFTGNYKQAQSLIELAREKNVFITEAIWTRYMPSRWIVKELLDSGIIGEVTSMEAEFSIPLMHVERLCSKELAGGALLDLGMYALTFASMYFGNDIADVKTECEKYKTGVDGTDCIEYTYSDGKKAILRTSFISNTRNEGIIYGNKGRIYVETLNNFSKIEVYDNDNKLIKACDIPEQINGYEYEVIASVKAIREGRKSCVEMPHDETLIIMKQMDDLRAMWDVRYPFDED